MERIVFLDIDGVLNNYEWFRSKWRKLLIKLHVFTKFDDISMISPRNIYWLHKLTKKYPDIKFVMSSSWRHMWNQDGTLNDEFSERCRCIDNLFKRIGLHLISRTGYNVEEPEDASKVDWNICKHCIESPFEGLEIKAYQFVTYARGAQIIDWLKHNGYQDFTTRKDLKIVILDDDVDDIMCFYDLQPFVVQSFFQKRNKKPSGFSKKQFELACKLLEGGNG